MLRPSLPVYPVSGQFQSPSACLKGANSFRWRPLAAVQARISVAWVSPLVHESVWFTLVINGDNDVIIYSINSWILQQNIPNAQLIIYPDANHGSQYQYPECFVRHVSMFLSE